MTDTEMVECPSGLTGAVRGLTVGEERILANKKLVRSGQFVQRLLDACWVETNNPGPYEPTDSGHPDWREVLQGDRFVALIAIRAATYGSDYEFRVSCSACRERIEWRIDLHADLKVKPIRPEDLERFRRGELFEAQAGGYMIKYSLPIGRDEERIGKLMQKAAADHTPISTALRTRIVEVEGLSTGQIQKFLGGLSLRDARRLQHEFEAHNCGVETSVQIDCPHCGEVQDVDVPFGRTFWMPDEEER